VLGWTLQRGRRRGYRPNAATLAGGAGAVAAATSSLGGDSFEAGCAPQEHDRLPAQDKGGWLDWDGDKQLRRVSRPNIRLPREFLPGFNGRLYVGCRNSVFGARGRRGPGPGAGRSMP